MSTSTFRRPKSWTDNSGIFVEAMAKFLNVSINILITGIPGPILTSGLAGPLITVHKIDNPLQVFHMGLIKDRDQFNGHYQHLVVYQHSSPAPSLFLSAPVQPSPPALAPSDPSLSNLPTLSSELSPLTPAPTPTTPVRRTPSMRRTPSLTSPSPVKVRRSQIILKYLREAPKKYCISYSL